MPSSPSPNDYTRTPQRFVYRGISLTPQDALMDTGKIAFAKNVRSYMEGTVGPRYGLNQLTPSPLPAAIHSLFRLNDTTPYGGASPQRRILGVGTALYAGTPGVDTYAVADAGPYSGNPFTGVVAAPAQSPRPWLYIGDSTRMRKINSDLNDLAIGLAQPLPPPSAVLGQVETTYLDSVGAAAWTTYGAFMTPVAPAPAPTTSRITATVTQLLYDSGTTGMASVSLDDMSGVTAGATVQIGGGGGETVFIDEVHPAVSPTSIAAILYDSGATGLCTIQPVGGFALGQIEAPDPEDIKRRYTDFSVPSKPRISVNRTVDFPVNALLLLGGAEVVRLLSVAIGPDGIQSFRCSTVATLGAGAAIVGIASFRAYFQSTRAIGNAAAALALNVTLTPPTTAATVGGVQTPLSGGTRNWGLVGARATQPEDVITFGIKISEFAVVDSVRLLLDVAATVPPFLENYYQYEWRASDLKAAIQSGSPTPTTLVSTAQADAVEQGQVDQLYSDEYGADPPIDAVSLPSAGPSGAVYKVGRDGRPRLIRKPDGQVSVGSAASRQLAVGDDQWMTLRCRVGDLTRVGTDATFTLGDLHNAAIIVQVSGTTNAIVIQVSDGYIRGGYGPDVGPTLPPYVYRYRYRDAVNGSISNPSPPMRAGVSPLRGLVNLTGTQSTSSGVLVDWFRYGGAMARWAYVGTSPNAAPPVFDDDTSDQQIDGGETLRVDAYQPWPVSDLPREGTVNVAGTAVEWVSGDVFDQGWAADSAIVINGIATTLYRSPSSTTRLEVVDNCGSGAGLTFSLPSPTILARPMPALWGGPLGNAWFHFACGDPTDPGILRWTNGNDPDTTSDANYLIVSSGSEPLQNGFFYDGVPFVFSTEQLYRIVPTFGDVSPFRCVETGCTRGLWSRWFMAVADDGVYFGNKAGIFFTNGGPAVSITDPDLQILFPQDGTSAEAIRNLNPIDFAQTTKLKLAVVDGLLYFDYVDTAGQGHTLLYEPAYKRWTPDAYLETGSPLVPVGATARISEPGPLVHNNVFGAANGHIYEYDLDKTADVLENLNWAVWPQWAHGGDPTAFKQWGDSRLDMHPGSSFGGILVTPVTTNGNVALTQRTLGIGGTVRDTFLVEVGAGSGGEGVLSRNFGLLIEGAVQACDTQRPLLYLWEPAFIPKQVSIARRATDWEDLGYKGAKFVQGVMIRANTFGATKSVAVQYDGVNTAPQTALTLSLTHNGERQVAYPLAAAGWTPFIAELVRLQGADDVAWAMLDWRWIWEPAPELATQWETQYTTFDAPGFLHVHDGIVAYQSTADVNWFIEYQDGSSATYTLVSSAGLYRRIRQITKAQKGKAVRFRWTSNSPFRLFKQDCSVRWQPWGMPGGFQVASPFGGPSRADGAAV